MPPLLTAELATMTNIANAIRAKDGTTAPIVARNFANRIRMIPMVVGNEDDRRVFRFANPLTQTEEDTQKLIKLDGMAAYLGRSQEIYELFKGDWLKYPTETKGFDARAYDAPQIVGNKLYLGSTSTATSIFVIDTVTGRIKRIGDLPSRVYNHFRVVGNNMYCLHTAGTLPTINSIICINTTTDAMSQIPVANRIYNMFAVVGTRLYLGSNTSAGDLQYIDTTTNTVGTLSLSIVANRAHNQLFSTGSKLYVASNTAITVMLVVTSAGVVSQTTTLPSRSYNVWFLAGTFLYVGSTTAYTSILRINTGTDACQEVVIGNPITANTTPTTPLPSRAYTAFVLSNNNKIYVGSSSGFTSIIRIVNASGNAREISNMPSRAYTVFQPVGDKIYIGSGSINVSTLVIIDTDMDDFSEIILDWPGNSRPYAPFILYGSFLYALTSSTAATAIMYINTTNDTVGYIGIPVAAGVTARSHTAGVIAHGLLYLGSTTVTTIMPVIDLATNTVKEMILGIPLSASRDVFQTPLARQTGIFVYMNDKIYVLGAGNAVTSIVVMTDAVMPHHFLPVYIKHSD